MELTAVLVRAEEGGSIALNPATGTTTRQRLLKERLRICEATVLYPSEFPLPFTGHPVVTVFTVPAPGRP